MIYQVTYMSLAAQIQVYKNGKSVYDQESGAIPLRTINPWATLVGALANTGHTFVFIVTSDQQPDFLRDLKKHGLEKYITCEFKKGSTNRNYPDKPNRLRVFILKGEK
jgi:hypothetical protein